MLQTSTTSRAAARPLPLSLVALPAVARREDHALERLKAMSDYMAGLTTLEVAFDSSVEVITTEHENLQFNSPGVLKAQRPDQLSMRRTGGFSDAEIIFDGQTAIISDATDHRHARLDAPGTLEALHDVLRVLPGVTLPAAELLGHGAFDRISADLTDAKTTGPAMISGELCEHLAFRGAKIDFQIWVHMGEAPRPCKLVINSRTVLGAPQYTLQLTAFKTDVTFPDVSFTFAPAADTKEVKLSEIGDLDEIPQADAK